MRQALYKLFKKGEYTAAAFYCREWLSSPNSKEGIFFKSLFEDEFLHWRFFVALTQDSKRLLNQNQAREEFIENQRKILSSGDTSVGTHGYRVTDLSKVKNDYQLVGLSSRFLVFRYLLGNRFTKDLKGEDKVGLIQVVDESNHLFYKLINLVDPYLDYSFLWRHPSREKYEVKRYLLLRWSVKYIICIFLFLPIDLFRIARTQIFGKQTT